MKIILILLFGNLVSLGFIALAAYIIYLDRSGWGWCIGAALVTAVTPKYREEDKAA